MGVYGMKSILWFLGCTITCAALLIAAVLDVILFAFDPLWGVIVFLVIAVVATWVFVAAERRFQKRWGANK